jgi:hypothetical protein
LSARRASRVTATGAPSAETHGDDRKAASAAIALSGGGVADLSYRGYAEGAHLLQSNGRCRPHGRKVTMILELISAEYTGRRLHELESALSSVDSRIASNYRTQENIKQELTDIGVRMIATDTTAEQRLAMVTRSADLGRRYGELTTEIQQLERERAVAERSLLEYRATLAAAF